MASSSELLEAVQPSDEDGRLARETGERLATFLRDHRDKFEMCVCSHGHTSESLEFPGPAIQLLYEILAQMAQGNAVALHPIHATLTPQQAADFLNVSTSYLELLVAGKQIPIHMVGNHRQLALTDLVAYKKQSDARRRAALEEISALGQEIDEGF